MQRKIDAIIEPPPPHMVGDGFRVHGFFSGKYKLDSYRTSPFLLLDYNSEVAFPPTDTPRGVGVHPHKGFETVTIAFKGEIAHHDSFGNRGVIKSGDVQWMTAGSGILHKEYHSERFSKEGGAFQMIQLWVNLPKKDKNTNPKYQELKEHHMGIFELENNAGVARIIAGNFNGVKGPAKTFSPMQLIVFDLLPEKSVSFGSHEHWNTFLLSCNGHAKINNQILPENGLAVMKNFGVDLQIETQNKCQLVFLSGEPINEPVVQYGPFVMNTREEIQQSIDEFHAGKFGHLE